MTEDKLKRWRLVLGKEVDKSLECCGLSALSADEMSTDKALEAIYNGDKIRDDGRSRNAKAGLSISYPNVADWLSDVRTLFPKDVVSVIQKDAICRKGLKSLLYEPEMLENVVADINMVSTLLELKDSVPEKSKDAARELVARLVADIMELMESDLRQAVTGSINRKNHSPIPHLPSMDWKRTISKNLKNYNRENGKLLAERFYFYERRQTQKEWDIIVDIDQSGSMYESVIYSSIMAAIFASISSVNTHVVAFDTEVVDLTEVCKDDPVDMLYGLQLGGGTDINKSITYCREFIERPRKTLFILISDLYEGGVEKKLLRQLEEMKSDGITVLTLLALSDEGMPFYDKELARKVACLDIPCFACTPNRLPELIGAALLGRDLMEYDSFFVK